jgi:hypothetical protein
MQATKDPDFQKYSNFAGVVTLVLGPKHGGFTRHWDPLNDDGDAFRLAVKLHLIVGAYGSYTSVFQTSAPVPSEEVVCWHGIDNLDPYAATRRAIVIAAAEIGRGKND